MHDQHCLSFSATRTTQNTPRICEAPALPLSSIGTWAARQISNALTQSVFSLSVADCYCALRFLHRLASVSSFISKGTKENPELKQTMATQVLSHLYLYLLPDHRLLVHSQCLSLAEHMCFLLVCRTRCADMNLVILIVLCCIEVHDCGEDLQEGPFIGKPPVQNLTANS